MEQTKLTGVTIDEMKAQLKRWGSSRWVTLGLVVGLLALAAAVLVPQWLHPRAPLTAPMPISSDIETQWGIRITQVAATADGGMVDLRYVVLDPNKAQIVGVDAQDTPVLVADDKTLVAVTAQMPHKAVLLPGTTYFLLYSNPHGAIHSQTYVTLLMGKVRLERVPVR